MSLIVNPEVTFVALDFVFDHIDIVLIYNFVSVCLSWGEILVCYCDLSYKFCHDLLFLQEDINAQDKYFRLLCDS